MKKYVYIYIYIYTQREREREKQTKHWFVFKIVQVWAWMVAGLQGLGPEGLESQGPALRG